MDTETPIPVESPVVPADNNPSKLYWLLKNIGSIPVITVLITAIAGPISVTSVNNSIKNKEIQKDIIYKVLEYTDKTNFAQTESLEKIGIIAKMVDNNKNVFGLDFSKTDEAFKEFYNIRSQFGLTSLQSELNQKKQETNQLKSLYTADSTKLERAKGEKQDLNAQLIALKEARDLTAAQKEVQKEQERLLKEQIQSQEKAMSLLNESIGNSKSKLDILESERSGLELKFREAQKKLEDLTSENILNIQKIRDQNVEIGKINNENSRLIDELAKLKIEMEATKSQNNSLKMENDKLKTPG